jgi:acyl-CoA thioesterase FadM
MARLKLRPLPHYPFSTDLVVRITDLNYGGHLGNDSLLSLVHEARIAFLAHHDLSEKDCYGTSLIIGDTAIIYQGEAFAGDTLNFEVNCGEPSSCGFRLFYRITRLPDAHPIALVENGMVCFDYGRKQIVPLPKQMSRICKGLSG